MYILAAMLLGGLLCNLSIRPVAARHSMSVEQLATERARAHEASASAAPASAQPASGRRALLVAAWTAVALPLAWGVWITVTKSLALFR
jgi:hypothetical protein